MSIITNIDNLNWTNKQTLHKDLEIKIIDNKYNTKQYRYIYPYDIEENNIKIPFAYAVQTLNLNRPIRSSFPVLNKKFEGILRDEQKNIRTESLVHLNKKGSVMISAYTGSGKTIISIYLACAIGFKTIIIVNKLILIKQWEESIKLFCPTAIIQKLTPKCKIIDADFYIINAINTKKMNKDLFSNIGLCIVDEAHLIMAECLSQSLFHIYPRYLIGLTATPYRPDGLNILLELYFGKQKVIREMYRKHTIYRVNTNFVPKLEKNISGRLDWNIVLESQANDHDRNELIIRILTKFTDRIFLVLVKRISQGEYIIKRLTELGESVTSLLGTQQEFNTNARILIGTNSKIGTGFDHAKLNTLLLAGDVEEYYIQYMGRIFRTKEGIPIIFDLVDKNKVLEKHFNTRKSIYIKAGGTIVNLNDI